jgi:hypothetical protein
MFGVWDMRLALFAARSSLDFAARFGFYPFHVALSKQVPEAMKSQT